MAYPLLSDYSLLRMLSHAIGSWGVLSETTVQRLVFFLSFNAKYNYPTIIKSEVARAEKMGLVKIVNGLVSFTDEANDMIKEFNIVDGLNEKYHKMIELEKKGMTKLAVTLKKQLDVEGIWWFPEEWRGKQFVIATTRPAREETKPRSIIPKKKMAKPRKVN